VTEDDESLYVATRAAAARVRQRLGQARTAVGSASTAFSNGIGLASWGSLGEKLNGSKACATPYKELQSAIRDAEAAIARAEAACDALMRATQHDQPFDL
jgi:hypothetical protein